MSNNNMNLMKQEEITMKIRKIRKIKTLWIY